MRYLSCDVLHEAIDSDGSSVDRERSHHADHISLEKGSNTAKLILFAEALPHVLVFELPEFVGLHQSLNVIEGIVEGPVTCATHSSSNHGHVNGNIVFAASGRSQLLGQVFDQRKVHAETCAFSD